MLSTCHATMPLSPIPAPPLEGQLCDTRLVEFAQALGDHAVVLLLRRRSQGKLKALPLAELQGDAGVFGRVGRGEETSVVAVLHILAVRLEHLRVRSEEHTSELQSLRHLVCR